MAASKTTTTTARHVSSHTAIAGCALPTSFWRKRILLSKQKQLAISCLNFNGKMHGFFLYQQHYHHQQQFGKQQQKKGLEKRKPLAVVICLFHVHCGGQHSRWTLTQGWPRLSTRLRITLLMPTAVTTRSTPLLFNVVVNSSSSSPPPLLKTVKRRYIFFPDNQLYQGPERHTSGRSHGCVCNVRQNTMLPLMQKRSLQVVQNLRDTGTTNNGLTPERTYQQQLLYPAPLVAA
jgi:hypothetical protein